MASRLNDISAQREFDSLVKDKKLKLARLSKAYSTSDLTRVRRAGVVNRVRLSKSSVDLTGNCSLTSKSDSNLDKDLTKSSLDLLTESFRNRTEHPAKGKTLERITKNIEKDRNSESVKRSASNSASKKRWQSSMQHTLSSQAKTKEARMMTEKRQQTKKSRTTRLPPIEPPMRNKSGRPLAQPTMAKVKSRVYSAPKPREVSATNPRTKQTKNSKRNFESSVCETCRLQITEKLKRGYNKYKILEKPKQCEKCDKFSIDYDFYQICWECAKNAGVCAKCASGSTKISGAKFFEVVKSGMEENMLSMNTHQLQKFAAKHAKVHTLEDVLSPIIAQSEASCSRTSSASTSRSSSSKTSPYNSRASSARNISLNSTSPTASSVRSDIARTMTSSSSPVRETDTTYASTDDVYSDEAYGSAVGSEDHRSGKLTQQVSYEELFPKSSSTTITEESDIINKIRSLTNMDVRSPTMAQSVLREIRSLTDINHNPDHDIEETNIFGTYSQHGQSPRPKSIIYDNDIQPNIRSRTSTSCSLSRPGSVGSLKLVPLDSHARSPPSISGPLPPILSPIIRGSSEHQEMISEASDDEIAADSTSLTPKTEAEETAYLEEEFDEPELTGLFDNKENNHIQDTTVTETLESATDSISEEISNVSKIENDVQEVQEDLHVPEESNVEETLKLDDDFIDDTIDDVTDDIFGVTENILVEETHSITPLVPPEDSLIREEIPKTPAASYNAIDIIDLSDFHKDADENCLETSPDSRDIYEHTMEFITTKEGIGTLDESLIGKKDNEDLYNYGLYARSDPRLDQTESHSNTSVEAAQQIENFKSSYDNTDMISTGDSEVFDSTFESDYTITDESMLEERMNNSELIHRVPNSSPTQEEWEEYQQQIEIARQECGLSGQYEILELHKGNDYPDMEFLENICNEYRGYPMRCKLADIPEEGTLSKETTCLTCTTHRSNDSTQDLEASSSSDMLVTSQTLTKTSETIISSSETIPAIPVKLLDDSEISEIPVPAGTSESSSLKQTEEPILSTDQGEPQSLEEYPEYFSLEGAAKGIVMNALISACIGHEGDVIGQGVGL